MKTSGWLVVSLAAWVLLPLLNGCQGCSCSCSMGGPSGGPVGSTDRSDGALPSLAIPFVKTPRVEFDGKLQEEAWKKAASTGPFVHPGDGRSRPQSPAQATAKLFWDSRAVYIAFHVADPNPSSPFKRHGQDPHIWAKASGVEVMVQPGDPEDNKAYFEVQVDVNGAVWDTRFDDYNRPVVKSYGRKRYGHQAWSAAARRGVSVEKGHYTLELAIPWASFSPAKKVRPNLHLPPHRDDTWRVNLYAFRDGQRRASAWSPLLGKGNFHRTTRFARVRFKK
jgi:hypothetical protein